MKTTNRPAWIAPATAMAALLAGIIPQATPAAANNTDSLCYMQDSQGKVVDLRSMCKTAAPKTLITGSRKTQCKAFFDVRRTDREMDKLQQAAGPGINQFQVYINIVANRLAAMDFQDNQLQTYRAEMLNMYQEMNGAIQPYLNQTGLDPQRDNAIFQAIDQVTRKRMPMIDKLSRYCNMY